MRRVAFLTASLICLSIVLLAQSPKPPFTAKDVEFGRQMQATSLKIRTEVKDPGGRAEPFKMLGNLYFVGENNGEVFLLTSPQGNILLGAGYANGPEGVEQNITSLGFKMTDIKAILLNHNHQDQAGGIAYLKQKTGAPVMAAFSEIPFIEHGGALPVPQQGQAAQGGQPAAGQRAGGGGPGGYTPVKVDRALFDGDVIKVGPLSVTAYITPGHTSGSTTFAYTIRDGNKDYKAVQYCCWEYPDDLSRAAYVNEATVRHSFETLRKLMPVDVYLEIGIFYWGAVVAQPENLSLAERVANIKKDPNLLLNRAIFPALTAAREVEFDTKLAKLKGNSPIYP